MLPSPSSAHRLLQVDDKSNNAAYTLRQVYQKHLLAFEEYERGREDCADAPQCAPTRFGDKASKPCSEPRDDAEEAADILNAIMGLTSLPQEQAPPRKRAKSQGVVSPCALGVSRQDVPLDRLNPEAINLGKPPVEAVVCRRSLRRSLKRLTGSAFPTTSSPSTVSFARVAIMKRKSSCAIGVTEAAIYFVSPLLWRRFHWASGYALCARQRMRMVLLKVSSTTWMSLRRQPAPSRKISLVDKLQQKRCVVMSCS